MGQGERASGLGRHHRGYDVCAKDEGMCSRQLENEEECSRQREQHEERWGLGKQYSACRYLQVLRLGLGDRVEGDAFQWSQNRGEQVRVKIWEVQFGCSFGARGPPQEIGSRHFQDCKTGPQPSLTLESLVMALLLMHLYTKGQGDILPRAHIPPPL